MPKKLFRIEMVAFKAFYIEAESEEDAFTSDVVDDEKNFTCVDVPWENETIQATELSEKEAKHVRRVRPRQILEN